MSVEGVPYALPGVTMTEDSSTAAQDLQALCRQAGRRAADWQPASSERSAAQLERSPRRGLLKWALVGGSCALALGVLAAQLQGEATTTGTPHAAALAMQQQAAPATPAALEADAPVRWLGDELFMDLEAVPLAQAAQWLAAATRSTVAGLESLQPVNVTLHFRGRDTAAAWRQLLQGHAAVALACDASDCRVWISSEAPAAAATPTLPHSDARPRPTPAGPAPDESESQPDGSC